MGPFKFEVGKDTKVSQIYLKFITAHINSYIPVTETLKYALGQSLVNYSFEGLRYYNEVNTMMPD